MSQEGNPDSDYAEALISSLGIGSRRENNSDLRALFSADVSREKLRQEIRYRVRKARELLVRRVEEVKSLNGRPVLVGSEGSTNVFHLAFDSVFAGLDSNGKVFVSTSDHNIPKGNTVLFMANRTENWRIERIASPNLDNVYLRRISREEESLSIQNLASGE